MITEGEILIQELEELRNEHNKIEESINDLLHSSMLNEIELQKLKKHKLWLKDRIAHIESILYPDIIA